jgi:two-component system chemotaxis response regulator CheB
MIETVDELGRVSMFTCPECHGTLWELKDELLRYRCHVGHTYSIGNLDVAQGEKVESALWSALRALEERGALARRLAKQSREQERAAGRKI